MFYLKNRVENQNINSPVTTKLLTLSPIHFPLVIFFLTRSHTHMNGFLGLVSADMRKIRTLIMPSWILLLSRNNYELFRIINGRRKLNLK